ncbi:hypothetical protein ABGB18_10455 [Nonomuraea sp. B12E4]|uniref:hypothetical protein n=1 Tax=Nonomuraea sp. B12E4 TaxID=3153564 RepID=UPI00325E9A16
MNERGADVDVRPPVPDGAELALRAVTTARRLLGHKAIWNDRRLPEACSHSTTIQAPVA